MALTKVSGQIIDQPFDVGIITATNQYVSGIGTFANLRVLGDLQVDGTTTTLDTVVTSVDRLEVGANNNTVGVAITQSGSGDIFNLYDGSSEVFSVADGGTVTVTGNIVGVTSAYATKFYGDGSNLTNLPIDSTKIETGNTKVETIDTGSDGHVKVTTEGTERLRVQKGGNVAIGTTVEDTGAFRTLHMHGDYTRIKLTDQFSGTGNTDGLDIQCSGGSAYYKFYENGHVYFSSNNTNRLQITNTGDIKVLTAGATIDGNTNLKFSTSGTDRVIINGDGSNSVKVGTAASLTGAFTNLQLHNSGGSSRIVLTDQFTGTTTDDGFHIQCSGGGATLNLKENSHLYFRTNAVVSLTVTNDGKVRIPDTGKFTAGGDDDLQIYHNATNSYIENTTGDLFLQCTGSGDDIIVQSTDDIFLNPQGGNNGVNILGGGRVELYYNNSEKFRTQNTGVKVFGTLEVTQEYPSIRPTLNLNFAATKTLDRRITFKRDSVGTFIGEDGLVKYASNNVPRFDHDPTTRESLGLLIEESRTNLINYSSEMNRWTKSNCNVTENAVTAPDGTLTAEKIALSGATGYVLRSLTISSGSIHTYSVYMKKADNDFGMLRYRWNGSNYDSVNFDLANGTTSRTPAGVSSTSIIDVGNGWYRCIVTFTPTSTATSNFQIRSSSEAQTGSSSTYTGTIDGTRGVYVWGAQVEAGAFATSYIPTSGGSVTRAQDTAKITGTNFTDFYNQTEGTLVAHYYSTVDDGYLAQLENSATPGDDRIGFVNYAGYQGFVETGNSTQASLDNGTPTVGDVNKVAFAFKTNDFAVSLNSATPTTDTSGTMPTVDRMMIGSRFGGQYDVLKSTIRYLSYYPKRLPNAQLQGLTQQ